MKFSAILVYFTLFFSCTLQAVYAEDLAVKQKLIELESFIENQPPFFFRQAQLTKDFLSQEINQAIVLADAGNVQGFNVLLQRILMEDIEAHNVIRHLPLKEEIRQRLLHILVQNNQKIEQ